MNQNDELQLIATTFAPGDYFEQTESGMQIRSSHAPDPATEPLLDAEGLPVVDAEGSPVLQAHPWILDGLTTLDSWKQAHQLVEYAPAVEEAVVEEPVVDAPV